MALLRFVSALFILMTSMSCDEVKEYPWNPDWDKYTSQPDEPEVPQEPETPKEPETPVEPENPEPAIKGKGRYVWIDAGANFQDYANDKDMIASDLAHIKETGFTDVIVDVRPTNTGVLFKSSVEGELKKVDAWTSKGYVWLYRRPTSTIFRLSSTRDISLAFV